MILSGLFPGSLLSHLCLYIYRLSFDWLVLGPSPSRNLVWLFGLFVLCMYDVYKYIDAMIAFSLFERELDYILLLDLSLYIKCQVVFLSFCTDA